MHDEATFIASCSSGVGCLPDDKFESFEPPPPPMKRTRDESRPISVLNEMISHRIDIQESYFGACVIGSLINVVRPVGSRKSSTSISACGNNFALYK